MRIELTPHEARVIGCLIEKEITTPDQYPLLLSALTHACNQKSKRDPVLDLDEATVQDTLDTLMKKHFVSEKSGFGSRVTKYQHRFCNTEFGTLKLSEQETGIVCVLLLRGPQTPGELRSRSGRLHAFADNAAVVEALTELANREPDPLLGHASLHSSIIAGGTELSVIAGHSYLQWERRTLPGESRQDLDLELERTICAVKNHPGKHEVKGRKLFQRPSYRVPDDAEILSRLQKASPQSTTVGLSFWADSALAGKAGIPSVLFGPIGHGAHAVDEWVSLNSLLKVYETLKQLILDF